jgi:probable F420-dependent oxidoreductase
MTVTHPFQFSLQAFDATSAAEWVDTCRRAESLGYATLFTTDHYFGPGEIAAASGHRPVDVAPISAMTMAAAVTTEMKVGCRVFCVDYHQPVVLAKELATVDFLSGGRLVAAIGAGWVKAEYDGMGIVQDRPGVRIARLAEAVEVLRAHWSGEPIDVQGQHLRVTGFTGTPAPVQQRIPLMIGGGAEKVLTLAGRVADIVSFNFNNAAGKLGASSVSSSDEEQTLQKLQWVRDAAGDRFDQLELEIGAYFIAVTDDRDGAATAMGGRFGVSADAILSHPHTLIGSVEQICETLEERRARFGISNICVAQRHLDEFAPVVARLAGR